MQRSCANQTISYYNEQIMAETRPLLAMLLALSFRCTVKISLKIQFLISFHSVMIRDNIIRFASEPSVSIYSNVYIFHRIKQLPQIIQGEFSPHRF